MHCLTYLFYIYLITHGENCISKITDTAVLAEDRKRNYKFKCYGHYVKNIVKLF